MLGSSQPARAFVFSNFSPTSLFHRPRRLSTLPPPTPHDFSKQPHFQPAPSSMRMYAWWRFKRLLSRPLIWILIMLITLSTWWSSGRNELSSQDVQMALRELFPAEITKDLQFYPASNHKIHYVGRWTTAPNRLRIDGAFPGVYFDLNVTNTSSLVLSLQNTKRAIHLDPNEPVIDLTTPNIKRPGQYSFSAASRFREGSPPVSLLALVDEDEYVILPNASDLVGVRRDLNPHKWHSIRIVAPMSDNDGKGVIQFDGLWLDKGGMLLPVEGSLADNYHSSEMDDFDAESDEIGEKHRMGLGNLLHIYSHEQVPGGKRNDDDLPDAPDNMRRRRKLVEIVTDSPTNLGGRKVNLRTGGADGLLSGVMGWEYLLGEMFTVDHVTIGVGGMCLLQDCVRGTGAPHGMADVFFRSGPVSTPHFGHPWPFQSYAPDVLIFNLGSSDYYSLTNFAGEYNSTSRELYKSFEDTYVALIKAVRSMAYPSHPATIELQRLGVEAYAEDRAPPQIPIFIMRPFGGEMEHATQSAVNRLRIEGDKGVYWLDTSGWLDFEGFETRDADLFNDLSADPPRWRLTEKGNQKVAIYLHMHVCRYLAGMDEKCAFLPPEVYQGQVFDPSVATFERYIENEKERQMKELFWEAPKPPA